MAPSKLMTSITKRALYVKDGEEIGATILHSRRPGYYLYSVCHLLFAHLEDIIGQ